MPVSNKAKRVRLIDVAEKAGVSRIVAGHVLLGSGGKTTRVSPATADRVRVAAKELDYRPNLIARQLMGVRTKTLGVLIYANRYTIHYDRMRAIDFEADRRGYRLMVGYLHRENDDAVDEMVKRLDEMFGRGVEGMILMRGFYDLPKSIVKRLEQHNLVVCERTMQYLDSCSVDVDLIDGLDQLVGHVAARGRKHPVLLMDMPNPHQSNPRVAGFISMCKKHGYNEPVIWNAEMSVDTNDTALVRTQVDKLLDRHLETSACDVILACNDLWGVQVIKSLLDRGIRVPDDIAVTGIDNVEIASACVPELTTIDQCNQQFAVNVMDLMSTMIEGGRISQADRHVRVKPKLVVRASA